MKPASLHLLIVTLTASALGESLETKYPLSKFLGDNKSFNVAGDATLVFEQAQDTTRLKLDGQVIETIKSPQFVEGFVKSENGKFALVLIGSDRPMKGVDAAWDYHSVLKIEVTETGSLSGVTRFLAKSDNFMKTLNRWIVKIDSVLNDGRTIRVKWGEQKSIDDPSKTMRYSWQIRDLDTGALYRDESGQ